MKFLITGYNGQLGYDIVRELKKRGYTDYLALDKDKMDITNKEEVNKVIKDYNPEVIFHCAAWTAVDKAEVVESQYGFSVCFFMKSGGQTYVPLDQNSSLGIGSIVDLTKAQLVTLERPGEQDIYRVRA